MANLRSALRILRRPHRDIRQDRRKRHKFKPRHGDKNRGNTRNRMGGGVRDMRCIANAPHFGARFFVSDFERVRDGSVVAVLFQGAETCGRLESGAGESVRMCIIPVDQKLIRSYRKKGVRLHRLDERKMKGK